jgi:hypothetical protein
MTSKQTEKDQAVRNSRPIDKAQASGTHASAELSDLDLARVAGGAGSNTMRQLARRRPPDPK